MRGRFLWGLAALAAGPLAAQDRQDPSQDPCAIAAQKGSVGVYRSLEQRRTEGPAFGVEVEEWVERNLWEDPGTLILRFYRTGEAAKPFTTITEILTQDGMDIVIEDSEGRQEFDFPFRYDCAHDPETGAYRLDLYYEQERNGAPFDHINQIEGDRRAFSLVRLARPAGTDAPYRWIATLTAHRPSKEDR